MPIQVQLKVLPSPSGEVVRVSAGGRNLVGGTEMDSTTVELEPGKKFEIEGEIEQRVVFNPDQFAATIVPLSDVDGSKSFAREEEEKKKIVAEEDKKVKEDLDKKFKEAEKREDKRLGRPEKKGEESDKSTSEAMGPPKGDHVAGNVTGSKEVKGEENKSKK